MISNYTNSVQFKTTQEFIGKTGASNSSARIRNITHSSRFETTQEFIGQTGASINMKFEREDEARYKCNVSDDSNSDSREIDLKGRVHLYYDKLISWLKSFFIQKIIFRFK